ncbi:hypothetical protein AJ80_05175 [Polytolypa hystricis UAMH7299]|uniref:Uncharacterized protein n=1 Tax=Polytolypa hystricis (strain UAMH7299) TaxID=1447883 RepID=A0A2B7Y5H8_POLH7|nr:hypothetical protein AJ80_05175 [Polytolypa hystricis UAMH7299]
MVKDWFPLHRFVRRLSALAHRRSLGTAHQPANVYSRVDDPQKLTLLFQKIEADFPTRWRKDCWYLTTIASLIACGKPALLGPLYRHLVNTPNYHTSVERQRIVRRMREAMIMCIILNGIPVVMEVFMALAQEEQPED